MKKLTVELGDNSYPIYIGEDLLNDKSYFENHINSKQLLIVSNETIAPLYLEKLQSTLHNYQIESYILPDGERFKSLQYYELIITELLKHRFSRNATLVALGGGVVGDITGFAAACYQRGVPFIQVPTTLLAQVDSSVGGKTAVNHSLGKNMIGAFHQPIAVIADTTVLDTLEDRELIAGLAEVIKYGLIQDYEFFVWLEQNIAKLLNRDKSALAYAIETSCLNKSKIVEEDEKESGRRALLNLGHTFGHAVETAQNYKGLLHGEAVGLGMLMAAEFSQRMSWIDSKVVSRIESILVKTGLPTSLPKSITLQQMLDNMAVDKKAKDGNIFFILLKAIGDAVITKDYDKQDLIDTINAFINK